MTPSDFDALWRDPHLAVARDALLARADAVVELAREIQQIPAPTFAEQARAAMVAQRLRQLGLDEVQVDERSNVYGLLRGQREGPGVMVSAHLDTVFPADTELAMRRDGDRLYGPGIGDNSLGVAGLIAVTGAVQQVARPRDLWVVANVGEEGLGDLNGMRAAVARLRERIGACIVLEGMMLGRVVHGGLGVERRRLIVECDGGHSWGDFGAPSAIHALCQIGAEIADWELPQEPRSSFNLGIIEGGTSVNTIAARAVAELDLRSTAPEQVARMLGWLDGVLARHRREGVRISAEFLGSRPAAQLSEAHPLVRAAAHSLRGLGRPEVKLLISSTDANIPLSLGIPAVCLGLTEGDNAHRLDEYIELSPLPTGLHHLFDVIVAALALVEGDGNESE